MKKFVVLFSVLNAIAFNLKAQQLSEGIGNNEVRFNIAMAIAGLPELNYEYILSENMGLGMAALVSVEKPEKMIFRSQFAPYFRMYFGKKRSAGFFIEGNMALVGQRDIYDEYVYDPNNPNSYTTNKVDNASTNFGFGAAVGVKLLTRDGVVGEVFTGGGRLFGESITGGYFRAGIAIGKRF